MRCKWARMKQKGGIISGRKKATSLCLVAILLAIVLVTSLIGCGKEVSWTGEPTVHTKYGGVKGIEDEGDTWVWKGIPYAKAPVGELRWRAPQDPEPWDEVRYPTDSFDACSQPAMFQTFLPLGEVTCSEDCLYLNIWRPQTNEADLPVYFWIHGGGNYFGGAKVYHGATMANQSNMVVVVIQYRLGPLGWFNHPALKSGASTEEKSGNFGTLDTIKALEWVRDNIEAFGGDPNNITIAGESAGAHNVTNLLISPLAVGLFHRAISQSGGMQTVSVDAGITRANTTIEKLLVSDGTAKDQSEAKEYRESMSYAEIEEYLRVKDAKDIIEAQLDRFVSMNPYGAYEDGVVIPGSVLSTIESGDYNRVPIILGSNEYETKLLLPLLHAMIKTSSGHSWFDLYRVLDPEDPLSLDDVMPTQADKDLYEALGYYGSRNWKAKYVDAIARRLKEEQNDVYAYLFKWGGEGSGPEPFDFIFGAAHAMEIPFFFGSDRSLLGYSFTEENRSGREELQEAMMAYVAQFVAIGDPNKPGSGLAEWEEWSNVEGEPKAIIFDATKTEANIGMMSEEVTQADVQAAVDKLPPGIRSIVQAIIW